MTDQETGGAAQESRMIRLLRRAVFCGWRSLPALAIGAALVGLAQVLVSVLAPGLTPLTLIGLVLVLTPPAGLLLGVAVRAVGGEDVTVLEQFRAAPAVIPRAMAIVAVPALFAGLLLVAREVWRMTAQPLVVVPYGLSGAALLISALTMITALPLALRRTELRLRSVWAGALAATARQPLPPLGALAVGVIGHWLSVTLYQPLWWLVPLPLALVTALSAALLTEPEPEPEIEPPSGFRRRAVRRSLV